MDVNLETLKGYGLSETQLKKLDLLDGTDDNKIDNSIFEAVKKYQEGIDIAKYIGTEQDTKKIDIFNRVKEIIGETFSKSFNKNPVEITKMQEFADSAADYYIENGSTRGFEFVGFPKGIQGIHINTKFDYDDAGNDTFSIDNEGKNILSRESDALILTVNFVLNGKEYTVTSMRPIPENSEISGSELEEIPEHFKN